MMKNKIVITLIIGLLAIVACKKTPLQNGGSWTFRSHTYNATLTNFINSSLMSYTGPNYPTGVLGITWVHIVTVPTKVPPDTAWVHDVDSIYPRSGTYNITSDKDLQDSSYVYVFLTDSLAGRLFVPSGATTATLTVVRNGSDVRVSIPSLNMAAASGDSGVLTANLILTPKQ